MRFRLLALGLAMLSTIGHAEPTANEVLKNIKGDNGLSTFYTAYITGNLNGLGWANADLGNAGRPRLYCEPEKLGITADQSVRILRDRVEEDPKLGTLPAGFAMLLALQRTFPCKG
jgi:hypothetical protein